MREVVYIDEDGCKYKTLIPDDAPDSHAELGIIVGPPDLSALGLPLEFEVRLNNLLYARGFFTASDVARRREELIGVWQAVLNADVQSLIAVYIAPG